MNTARKEPKRDRWGRYLLPDPVTGEERAWTRVTTINGLLSDRFHIERWAERQVAFGLSQRPDLALLAKGVRDPKSRSGKDTLNRVAKAAKDAAASDASANIGTALHAASEVVDEGGDPDLPAPYDRDIEAYRAAMKKRELRPLVDESGPWIERIVVVPELGVAGTLDRVLIGPGLEKPRVADLKTGRTVDFSHLEHAIQQACYANASHYYDAERDELVPMPELDLEKAFVMHLPAGEATCSFYEIDIVAGWEAAKVAAAIKNDWRKREDLSVKV